jgi:GNAT superfamily N-acetyltransferase
MDDEGCPGAIDLVSVPTQQHLDDLEAWLRREQEETGEGFFCNWNIIQSCFDDNVLHCAVQSGVAVALSVWERSRGRAEMHIVTVRPDLRRAGVGRRLVEHTMAELQRDGVVVVEGECKPTTSEPFWRRLGFEDPPRHPHGRGGIRLFRRLVDHHVATDDATCACTLTLWSAPDYGIDADTESWTWNLGPLTGDGWRLGKPIIHPCPDPDWCVEVRASGNVLFRGKLKYLPEDHWRTCSGFLYVDRLSAALD